MLYFLIARLSSSLPCCTRTQLGFLHHNASRMFYSFSSVVESSESNQLKQNQEANESFTISYLMNSCGVPVKVATEISKRVKLKDPDKPDSVFHLFRSYGFSETQISKIVKKYPRVLLAKPERTLLPKLKFIQSIGFSNSELPELLIFNPIFLSCSLKKCIIPYYEALKSVLDEDWKIKTTLKRSGWKAPRKSSVKNIVPNIKVLRDHGVPQSSVFPLLRSCPRAAFMNHAIFVENVKFTKEIGIEPSKTIFIQAVIVLAQLKQSTWESKLDMFERCGWSRDVTLSAFSKFPICMLLSEEKVTKSMKFLVNEMGFPLEDIAGCPTILCYRLKQRMIPRWSVVKILKTKGLIKNSMSIRTIIIISEKKFLEKFVIRFQDSVPHLLEIYRAESRP